jgi:hypothetical protein
VTARLRLQIGGRDPVAGRDGVFLRADPTVAPTMLRGGAVVSESEVALLRRIEVVVRLGRVRRITRGFLARNHRPPGNRWAFL